MKDLKGRTLVVASHNAGKLREFADLTAPFGIATKSAKEFGLPEPEETGTTFEENAYIKAFAAAGATGLPAMSDDSGLVVDALDGQPGVYTANWAERPDGTRDFMMAMEKTERLLKEKGATDPAARTDVPAFARMRGVQVLEVTEEGEHTAYLVRDVRPTPAEAAPAVPRPPSAGMPS